jgi:hypothetical protein
MKLLPLVKDLFIRRNFWSKVFILRVDKYVEIHLLKNLGVSCLTDNKTSESWLFMPL